MIQQESVKAASQFSHRTAVKSQHPISRQSGAHSYRAQTQNLTYKLTDVLTQQEAQIAKQISNEINFNAQVLQGYKGIMELLKEKEKNDLKFKEAAQLLEKSVLKEESDDDLKGRSVWEEINYSDKKKAMNTIKETNKQNIILQKLKVGQKQLNKLDVVSNKSVSSKRGSFIQAQSTKSSMRPSQGPSVIKKPTPIPTPEVKEQDSIDSLLLMFLENEMLQSALNQSLKEAGKQLIEFEGKTLEDMQKLGLQFETLSDIVNKMQTSTDLKQEPSIEQPVITPRKVDLDFDPNRGINLITYEANHDPLKVLGTKSKKMCFPNNMFDTCSEFKQTAIPATDLIKSAKFDDFRIVAEKKKAKNPLSESPAGMRIPKIYKKTLADKIPNIVTSLKKEGIPDEDIRKCIYDKQIKSVQKYGNKSHIGMILEFNDKSLLNSLILNEQRHLANETKKTQDFNKQVAKEAELKLLRQQFDHIVRNRRQTRTFYRRSQYTSNQASEWSTTNQKFFSSPPQHQAEDLKQLRKNFKKRTPFTHWSDAYFANGVFFNPPVTGI